MKIAINTHFFKYPASGMGQYLLHLTNTLLEIDQENDYCLLGSTRSDYADFHHPRGYSVHTVPKWARRNANVAQFVWEQRTGPLAAHRARADILHYPYFAAPLRAHQPTIVTVPDMIQLRLPEYLEGLSKQSYIQFNRYTAARAAMLITLSEHAKKDIIELMHVPAERIRVIGIAAGDEYQPIADIQLLAQVRTRYHLGKRYIFYLGGLDCRKNVLQLLRAFALLTQRLADPDLQLFIAGDPDKYVGPGLLFPDPRPLARELGIAERVVYQFVAEQDKALLYSGAQVFVFPSLYEGFGLTPLEAMKCGAPVICSNRTALPEVVGEAAITLDPQDTKALADAMYAVLTNPSLRAELVARSLQQARFFSWQKTARATLAIYEEIYRSGSGLHIGELAEAPGYSKYQHRRIYTQNYLSYDTNIARLL